MSQTVRPRVSSARDRSVVASGSLHLERAKLLPPATACPDMRIAFDKKKVHSGSTPSSILAGTPTAPSMLAP